MDPDFYAILGVAADADADQIKAAFRALARTLHPDAAAAERESGPERLTQVVAAWRVLHDPAKRAAYDRTRAHAVPDTADWPGPAPHSLDSGHDHSQAPLIAGPTVIHARTPLPSGPHVRVGPTIRLHD